MRRLQDRANSRQARRRGILLTAADRSRDWRQAFGRREWSNAYRDQEARTIPPSGIDGVGAGGLEHAADHRMRTAQTQTAPGNNKVGFGPRVPKGGGQQARRLQQARGRHRKPSPSSTTGRCSAKSSARARTQRQGSRRRRLVGRRPANPTAKPSRSRAARRKAPSGCAA